jgi:hypothetical protein
MHPSGTVQGARYLAKSDVVHLEQLQGFQDHYSNVSAIRCPQACLLRRAEAEAAAAEVQGAGAA